MGEYVWTVMHIGGKAPTALLEGELPVAIHASFGGGGAHGDVVEDLIAAAIKDKVSLCVQGEINFGEPDELTEFCRQNNLAYHYAWSAKPGVFDAGCTYWAPGMDKPVAETATDEGDPSLDLNDLRRAQREGKTLEQVFAELAKADASVVPALEADDLLADGGVMRVARYLDLSTAHLTPATRAWLDALDFEVEGPSGGRHPFGWNLYVHDDNTHRPLDTPLPGGTPEGEYPPDLWACFEKARELGCTRIHFDADAEASDQLPCYDDAGNEVKAEEIDQ